MTYGNSEKKKIIIIMFLCRIDAMLELSNISKHLEMG